MLNRTLRILLVTAFAAAALVGLNGTATADSSAESSWSRFYWAWQDDGDKGGRTISEEVRHTSGSRVGARFDAKGEVLRVWDLFDNDRATMVKLWVGGSGPAIFYSHGWDETKYNLSYAEGQAVYLQVCTSSHPNAVCSSKAKYKGIS